MDVVTYSRRLAACVNAGVPVAEAAAVLASDDPTNAVARDLAVRLAAGELLAGALRRHTEWFPPYFIALVEAGEVGGWLDNTLAAAADELALTDDAERRLCRGWRLPGRQRGLCQLAAVARTCGRLAALVEWGILLVDALELTAASVIDEPVRRSLRAARQAVEATGSLARSRKPLLPPLLWRVLNLGSLTGTFPTILHEMGSCFEYELALLLAGRGAKARRRIATAVFTRKFAALLRCGVPVTASMELLAAEYPESSPVRKALTRPQADRGYRLSELLATSGLFEEWQLDVIDLAETDGRLDVAFQDLADYLVCPDEATSAGTIRKLAFLGRWDALLDRAICRAFGTAPRPLSQLLEDRGLSALEPALLDAGEADGDLATALSAVEGLHALQREIPDTISADECRFLAGWAAAIRLGIDLDECLRLLQEDQPRMAETIRFIRHAIAEDPGRLTLKRLTRSGLVPWIASGIAAGATHGLLSEALDRLATCERIRLRRQRVPLLRGRPIRRRAALAHASRVAGTLLGLGATVEDALDAVASGSGDRATDQAIRRVYLAVARGTPLSRAVATEPVFPPLWTAWVGWGESSGALDVQLLKIADLYEAELERTVNR